MLISQVNPSNLHDEEVINKFWLLRGQALHWDDTIFADGLCFIFIIINLLTIMRCFRHLQALLTAIDQSMLAMMGWLTGLFGFLSVLAVSMMTLLYLVHPDYTQFGRAFVALFYSTERPAVLFQEGPNAHAPWLYSFTELLCGGVYAFLWIFLVLYFPYVLLLSTLSDSYRIIFLQTKQRKSLSKRSTTCKCLTSGHRD